MLKYRYLISPSLLALLPRRRRNYLRDGIHWNQYKNKYDDQETLIWNDIPSIIADIELHKMYLAAAVAYGYMEHLKQLLEAGKGIEFLDHFKETLVHFAVRTNRPDALTYLLQCDGVQINAKNSSQQTALMVAAEKCKEKCALKLIEAGADLSFALHYAVDGALGVAQALLDHGADINARNSLGRTALYCAVFMDRVDAVHMLLYYGADANIPTWVGFTPFDIAGIINRGIQDILFDYVYDGEGVPMFMCTLLNAMATNSHLLEKLFENCSEIIHEPADYLMLCENFYKLHPKYFRMFIQRFDYVMKEVLVQRNLFEYFIIKQSRRAVQNMTAICEGELVYYLVEGINNCEYNLFTSNKLWYVVIKMKPEDTAIMQILLCLVIYGVKLDMKDLDIVYSTFGYCPLFKEMLEVEINTESKEDGKKELMPNLIYDVNMTIEDFLKNPKDFNMKSLHLALEYFAHPKLKQFCLSSGDSFLISKARELPQVPLLIQLSRDVAHRYIVDRWKINKFSQFWKIIERLPIPHLCKKILLLQRTLYQLPKDIQE